MKKSGQKKKAALAPEPQFGLEDLARVNEGSIKSAGPRYFLNKDRVFPNMDIESFDEAMVGLICGDEFRALVGEIAEGIRDKWNKADAEVKRLSLGDSNALPEPKRILSALNLLAHADPGCGGDAIVRIRRGVATAKKRVETLENRIRRDRNKRIRKNGGSVPFFDYERGRAISEYGYALNRADQFLPEVSYPFRKNSGEPISVVLPNACGLREHGILLLYGEWGMGKTHSLCHLTEKQMKRGLPVLLALAKDFDPGNSPGRAIARHSGLASSFSDLLRRLDSLGRKAGVRALLLVDGINERNPNGAWTRGLTGMLKEVRQYPFVGLAVSFRVPFRSGLSERAMSETPFMRHRGFEQIPFEAQAAFLEYYDVPLPEVPPMADEFSRPLTLKIICEIFRKMPKKDQRKGFDGIASGQKGMTRVLEHYVENRADDVLKKHGDLNLPRRVFAKHVWELVKKDAAPHMAANMTGQMPATLFLEKMQKRLSIDIRKALRILRDMDDEGIVILTRSAPWSRGVSAAEQPVRKRSPLAVQMPYQLFADHVIARHLLKKLEKCESAAAVRRCFRAGTPLGKIFSMSVDRFQFHSDVMSGVPELAEALILEFPERVKNKPGISSAETELLFHLPRWKEKYHAYLIPFLNGLYWRANAAVSDSTVRLANSYLRNWQVAAARGPGYHVIYHVIGGVIPALFSSACRAASPMSARRFLYPRVKSAGMPERDLAWNAVAQEAQKSEWIHNLFTWLSRLEQDGFGRLSPDGASNYVALLSVFLGSTDRPLRDKATEMLVAIGEQFPSALFSHALDTLDFDDIYYPERMLAASYGVAMARWSDPEAKEFHKEFPKFARAVVKDIFMPCGRLLTHHVLVRDYALGIAGIARELGVKFSKDEEANMSPPFPAVPSPFPPESEIDESQLSAAQSAFASSPDFYERYTIPNICPDGRYKDIARQIKWRVVNLGYTDAKFQELDRRIANDNWGSEARYGKVDRCGKKYSWIAYHEMFGLLDSRDELSEWQESRSAAGVLDPSFPVPPPECHPHFQTPPMDGDELSWLANSAAPDYGRILESDNWGGESGHWVMLEGLTFHDDKSGERDVFSFLRGLLVRESDIPRLRAALDEHPYPGNRKIPHCDENHEVFTGEIPWSRGFACLRAGADEGKAFSEVSVNTTAVENGGNEYHGERFRFSAAWFPTPDICARLGLSRRGRGVDLVDKHGQKASLYRADTGKLSPDPFVKWPTDRFQFLHLRKDLLDEYLRATGKRLVWIVWGERRLLPDLRTPRAESFEIKYARRTYQHIHKRLIVYSPTKK